MQAMKIHQARFIPTGLPAQPDRTRQH